MSAFEIPFNSPYHSVLYSPPAKLKSTLPPAPSVSVSSAAASRSSAAMGPSSYPADVVSSSPPPVVRFLILASPVAKTARRALEVVLWRDKKTSTSWCVVVGWWAVCLAGWAVVRYLLPPLVLAIIIFPHLPSLKVLLFRSSMAQYLSPPPQPARPLHQPNSTTQTTTNQSLLITLANFSAINAMLTISRPQWLNEEDWTTHRTVRALAGVWLTWVIGGWLVGVRIMLGLAGTILLLLPSPYVHPLLISIESSHLLSRVLFFLSILILGPSPAHAVPPSLSTSEVLSWAWRSASANVAPKLKPSADKRGRSGSIKELLGLKSAVVVEDEEETEKAEWEEEPVRFRFEVLENQRWWLALDWTSTLAPGDHPVWCDTHLSPVPPPPAFPLPPPSTITIPSPTSPLTHLEERTASWRWLDDDWSVLRNVEGGGAIAGRTAFVPSKAGIPSYSESAASPLPDPGSGTGSHPISASSGSGSSGGVQGNASPAAGGASGTGAAGHAPSLSMGGVGVSMSFRMSLGEQALSKGLERLKAATASSSSSSAAAAAGGSGPLSPSGGGGPSSPIKSGVGGSSTSALGLGSAGTGTGAANETTRTLYAMSLPEVGANVVVSPGGAIEEVGAEVEDLDCRTDEGGWSYGGNKWEGMGPKGGLGKFTRRRRWTRQAVLTEHVRLVPLPPLNLSPSPAPSSVPTTKPAVVRGHSISPSSATAPLPKVEHAHAEGIEGGSASGAGTGAGGGGGAGSGALRMRLKKAVEAGQGHH